MDTRAACTPTHATRVLGAVVPRSTLATHGLRDGCMHAGGCGAHVGALGGPGAPSQEEEGAGGCQRRQPHGAQGLPGRGEPGPSGPLAAAAAPRPALPCSARGAVPAPPCDPSRTLPHACWRATSHGPQSPAALPLGPSPHLPALPCGFTAYVAPHGTATVLMTSCCCCSSCCCCLPVRRAAPHCTADLVLLLLRHIAPRRPQPAALLCQGAAFGNGGRGARPVLALWQGLRRQPLPGLPGRAHNKGERRHEHDDEHAHAAATAPSARAAAAGLPALAQLFSHGCEGCPKRAVVGRGFPFSRVPQRARSNMARRARSR